MNFINRETGERLTHKEFVLFVWDETARQFDELHEENWCDLNKDEQIDVYCEQYTHQVDRNWDIEE